MKCVSPHADYCENAQKCVLEISAGKGVLSRPYEKSWLLNRCDAHELLINFNLNTHAATPHTEEEETKKKKITNRVKINSSCSNSTFSLIIWLLLFVYLLFSLPPILTDETAKLITCIQFNWWGFAGNDKTRGIISVIIDNCILNSGLFFHDVWFFLQKRNACKCSHEQLIV